MQASDITAVAASIIALSAVGVSIWQGYLARHHNRLSVKPKLVIYWRRVNECRFVLKNQGLGPAIIKSFSIVAGEQVFDDPNEKTYKKVFNTLGINEIDYEYFIPTKLEAFGQADELELLNVRFLNEDLRKSHIDKLHSGLKFEIEYSSLYEEETFRYSGLY